MTKDSVVQDSLQFSVSTEVKAILPAVLIEYLWALALCKEYEHSTMQLFQLECGILNYGEIQEVYHTCEANSSVEKHRIYGVTPVNCNLQVFCSDGMYIMQIYRGV